METDKATGQSGHLPADTQSDIDAYFTGPIDTTKASKLPYFMRIRGSVLPGLIIPLLFVASWAVWITCVHKLVKPLNINSVLLTVLGFLVGLALSFRSSTAYERNLARIIWVHTREKEGDEATEDVLDKLTAINLLLAFCISLKHKLRHQPEYDYKDLQGLITNLQTFAKQAHEDGGIPQRKPLKATQQISNYLGISFLEKHPTRRYKAYKKAGKLHGNLPLEIMTYISSYIDMSIAKGYLPISACQSMAMAYLGGMNDALTNCERISQTPLPLAYNIVISQITWLYVLFLPFQLVQPLGWIAIPGTLIAAYIILGFAAIGREIEDPFGDDVNDLNLDRYCESIAIELDMIMSVPPPNLKPVGWITRDDNYVMFPNTGEGYNSWKAKGIAIIREELQKKPLRHVDPALAREARHAELRARDAEIAEMHNESKVADKKTERPANQTIKGIPVDPSDTV
ncbi:hypothetical protein H072_9129 [Dactylellina haptotyla CBS 200.50]|uniref:Uncharacterized protein n=1 Tax=Dactylellina haptotyla (strain CBS 200.50) TaxID=1284197 RepID=S8A7W0_DACHA|nr:hypothetical protein H072_9129 [Dactylellina haptotyla CBS 200.50]